MNQIINQFYGNRVSAEDGDIGKIEDFYFDDNAWVVRYLVVETGSWLTGRQVLLSPHAFEPGDPTLKGWRVHLTRKQIEDSPTLASHVPVSRQYETSYYRYYGWPGYWESGDVWGSHSVPLTVPESGPGASSHHGHNQSKDVHLRSTQAISGYHLHAVDGAIGRVTGFRMDPLKWTIQAIMADTDHWNSGKTVFVPTRHILGISYNERTVAIDLTKAKIELTPADETVTR